MTRRAKTRARYGRYHCPQCYAEPRTRRSRHCRACGIPTRDLIEGVCAACARWLERPTVIDDREPVALLLTAIVERAHKDATNRILGRHTPTICPDCDKRTRVCAREFMASVRDVAIAHDGDPLAVWEHVAALAA